MKKVVLISLIVVAVGLVILGMTRKGKSLKKVAISPKRRKFLAEQYKAQLDGIFSQAAAERRALTAGEQVEVDRLQEKLIQLGYLYEQPESVAHTFLPSSWAFQPFLN